MQGTFRTIWRKIKPKKIKQKIKELDIPFINITISATPKSLPKQSLSTFPPFPQLKPAGHGRRHEHHRMFSRQSQFPQLYARWVRQRPRYHLRHVLGKRSRHCVIKEQDEPPRHAHATNQPAPRVETRPLRQWSLFFVFVCDFFSLAFIAEIAIFVFLFGFSEGFIKRVFPSSKQRHVLMFPKLFLVKKTSRFFKCTWGVW